MTRCGHHNSFQETVRQEIDRQGLSIRGLARKIDPDNLDRARRNLHRWLNEGMTPNRASRRSVAVALGLPPDEFASLEDDEEADPAMREAFSMFVDLMTRVQSLTAREGMRV